MQISGQTGDSLCWLGGRCPGDTRFLAFEDGAQRTSGQKSWDLVFLFLGNLLWVALVPLFSLSCFPKIAV